MPLPKRRHSSQRRDTRRSSNSKIKTLECLIKSKNTNIFHRLHHGYWLNGVLYFKEKPILSKIHRFITKN